MTRQATWDMRQIVAYNLRTARERMGVTQVEVGKAIGGAYQDQVSKWERGEVLPGPVWSAGLAEFFFAGDLAGLYKLPPADAVPPAAEPVPARDAA